MMTLLSGLAVLAVLAMIVGIARYNEDEALGWKLAVSFVGGALAVAVASKMLNSDKKQNNVVMVEKSPMQVAESMPLLSAVLADISFVPTLREKSPKPAGKGLAFIHDNSILSEVHRKARGQPQWEMYFSDS
jgi:hypothetical protein